MNARLSDTLSDYTCCKGIIADMSTLNHDFRQVAAHAG